MWIDLLNVAQIRGIVYGVFRNMKVTFELPPQRLRAHVPNGKRSKFVAEAAAHSLPIRANLPFRVIQLGEVALSPPLQ